MSRAWTWMRIFDGIVFALEAQGTGAAPEGTDDLHRLFQCLDRLTPAASRPTHGLNTLTKGACAQAKLDTTATEHVQCCRSFGQHCGRTQGQIGNIGEHMHTFCGLEQCGNQRPSLQKSSVVGMVLNTNIL